MADETMGMLSETLRVSRAARFASRGSTFEWAGTSSTSSNVSDFWITRIASSSVKIGETRRQKRFTCGRSLAAAPVPVKFSAKLRPNEHAQADLNNEFREKREKYV